MNTIAFFDFDGTLYKKDSLLEFTKYAKGRSAFWTGILILFPFLFALKMGFLDNEKVKTKFLTYFFKNMPIQEFSSLTAQFAVDKIPQDMDKETFNSFLSHIKSGHTVCIVSASCSNWIQPWSDQYDAIFIGTELEITDQKITGNLSTRNCFGIEKVNRIKTIFNLAEFDSIVVYGNGKGDFEMLQLSK